MKHYLYICLSLLFVTPLVGQDDTKKRLEKVEKELAELRDTHGREIERLQFGEFFPALGQSKFGMGPAASKVYNQKQGISLGGYGEFLFEQTSGAADQFDALRTVFYVGYRFDDKWVFNSEIELEHANQISAEFAYIEYLHSDEFNARGGLLLVPMGFINEMHEPTTFLSAQRPETERRILPSTWRENGVSAHGTIGDFQYKALAITSLDGEDFKASGLRGGRQKGSKASSDDFAFVGRLDWTGGVDGLTVGGAVFFGDTGQDGVDSKNNAIPAMRTTIVEAHAQYQKHGFQLRALYSQAHLQDTFAFNANTGNNLASDLKGWYVEGGYDIMRELRPDSEAVVMPFVRYEHIDTQHELANGLAKDIMQDEKILTFGVHWRPINQVVVKADFQSRDRGDDVFQIGFGYIF